MNFNRTTSPRFCLALGLSLLTASSFAQSRLDIEQADEDYIHTPTGFNAPGKPALATAPESATLKLTFLDEATGKPTPCRVNVIGPDGQYYQPAANRLSQYSLTGQWPATGKGNRRGKAPVRYLGRFFYSDGTTSLKVPPGQIRIEVWKGFEHEPVTKTIAALPSKEHQVEVKLRRTVSAADLGYYSGDTHLHLERASEAHENDIFNLLEAEDVRYGGVLCYNPTSSYSGQMRAQEFQQLRGLGVSSIQRRGDYRIISGQEYRSGQYGHTKVFLADDLVQPGKSYDPNTWSVFGKAVSDIRANGGLVFWAHGGYEKEIWADYILGGSDGIELMQFGIYRPIGLAGWYRILNIGFPYPALGASDYPPCRKFADCRTYVHSETEPPIDDWLRLLAKGQSFFTTGPLLLLEVDGVKPGGAIPLSGKGPHYATARVRVYSEVAPVTDLDLIVNGKTIATKSIKADESRGRWIELEKKIKITESSWIAARAHSKAPTGSPDAEAHTNPVHIYVNGKTPYNEADLNWLLGKLDGQIKAHVNRKFPPRAPIGAKTKAVGYFKGAREKLIEIRKQGGRQAP